MSHDTHNPFSNENGEYLQELSSSKNLSKEKAEPKKEQDLSGFPVENVSDDSSQPASTTIVAVHDKESGDVHYKNSADVAVKRPYVKRK